VGHPDGALLHEVDVSGCEADLLMHFSKRGRVRCLAVLAAPAEVVPDVSDTAQQGAVPADDEDAGAGEVEVVGERGERGCRSRAVRAVGGARRAAAIVGVVLSVRSLLRVS
jgi:hypothetical protein